jgi:hypothetical protein
MPQMWTYKVLTGLEMLHGAGARPSDQIGSRLAELAAEGWELVLVGPDSPNAPTEGGYWIFKRPT